LVPPCRQKQFLAVPADTKLKHNPWFLKERFLAQQRKTAANKDVGNAAWLHTLIAYDQRSESCHSW
jgi:hypothetical protein